MSVERTSGRLPLYYQNEMAECGLACLAMIACYHGHDLDLASLRRRFPFSQYGANLSKLIDISGQLGMDARALRLELEGLHALKLPAILHWDLNHFVVLRRVTRKGVELHDPGRGHTRMPFAEVSRHFTGIALELSASSGFEPKSERQQISIKSLIGRISGLGSALLQVALISLSLEVLTLVLPLSMQWVLDHALVSADQSLLSLLCVGFLAIIFLQSMLTGIRGWVVSCAGSSMSSQWLANLFGHLLRLPLSYFGKRSVGGVLSRFISVQMVQQTLTGNLVEAVLDGVTALLIVILLLLYSPLLTSVVLLAVVLYGGVRWLSYRRLMILKEDQLIYSARQQSQLVESIQGIQALKLASQESQRRAKLENTAIEVAKREASIGAATAIFSATSKGIFGAQRILVLWLAAAMTIEGTFTAGMLVGFVAYADIFSTRIGTLIDRISDLGMLRLHASRIADVALEAPEPRQVGYVAPCLDVGIKLENLSFRYGDDCPWILRDCSMSIEHGEFVAIVGTSGCGKTTLAKVLLGLLLPTSGQIFLGEIDICRIGASRYREQFGTVMQDDCLFAGSIADNISFFDGAATAEAIDSAARLAHIHDDIARMPMGYETLVGDMGSALSGGQKQRILLARALYRKPRILLLDEATSHLDVQNEVAISGELSRLKLTRIVIAHRPETILSADRIICLDNGRISEVPRDLFRVALSDAPPYNDKLRKFVSDARAQVPPGANPLPQES